MNAEEDQEKTAAYYKRSLTSCGVPEHIHGGLIRWVTDHTPPGDFLQAVLKNDLKMSFGLADSINTPRMFNIVNWLYNHAPGNCWGSPEKYEQWKAKS